MNKNRKGEIRMRRRTSLVTFIMFIAIVLLFIAAVTLTGCASEAENVSYNVSQEADNFNVVRRLTVLNARTDKPMFELIGAFSIHTDNQDDQLEVIVETGKGVYKKHFVRLNEWTMYVVEDIGGAKVNKYKYEINYMPEKIIPYTVTRKD